MKLVNVRLSADDARLVADLRARGVSVSDVVRRAIRVEAKGASAKPADPAEVLRELSARYPTPAGLRGRPAPASDARAARRLIRARLKRRG